MAAGGALALLGAVLVTAPFWVSALTKARGFEGARAEMVALGMPLPRVTALGVIALQALASLCLIAGWFIWPAALALVGFTALATLTAHRFWAVTGPERLPHVNAFLANTGLIGGLILLAQLRAPL